MKVCNISYRKALLSDAKEQTAIQREAFMPLYLKYQDDESPANITVEQMREKIENPYGKYFVIMVDNETVGGVYSYYTDSTMTAVYLCCIYVLPLYQGNGIAQDAIGFMERQYPDNVDWILDVPQKEEKNIHVYEKMGYRKTVGYEIINDLLTVVTYIKKSGNDVEI